MRLLDADSGKRTLHGQAPNCKDSFIDAYCFPNIGGRQKIRLFIHPGSYHFSVAEVLVEVSADAGNLDGFPEPAAAFETAKGIRAGLSRDELVSIPEPPRASDGNRLRYRVEFDDLLLDETNRPIYFANYVFENDRLAGFRYGFEYP